MLNFLLNKSTIKLAVLGLQITIFNMMNNDKDYIIRLYFEYA